MKADDVEIGKIYLLKRSPELKVGTLSNFPDRIKGNYWLGKCLMKESVTAYFEYFITKHKWYNLFGVVIREVDIEGKDKKLFDDLWMYEI